MVRLMRILLTFVAAIALAAPAAAQPVSTIDLSAFGWGVLATPVSVDTDGDPLTQEWFVGPLFSAYRRVIAIQPTGAMCLGDWVNAHGWDRQMVKGRTHLTRLTWPHLEIMTLRHPVC